MPKPNEYRYGYDAYKNKEKLSGEEPEEFAAGYYDALVDDEGLDSPFRYDFNEELPE